jgi:hypothetical protein
MTRRDGMGTELLAGGKITRLSGFYGVRKTKK